MKKLILALFLITTVIQAQEGRNEKIRAFKVAYITEELNLTASEAEKFWPVYNAYDDKMGDLRRQERQIIYGKLGDRIDAMSDADANKVLDEILIIKSKEFEYTQALVEDLKRSISPKKIIKLRKAEEEFKRKLLERIKQRRNNR
jgi:hypothetical protein